MTSIKDQVFGDVGYSADLHLSPAELTLFRDAINQHWLNVISERHPELAEEAASLGVQNYHILSDRLNHEDVWAKRNRILPQAVVNDIKKFPFMQKLEQEFGSFTIADAYDTEQHHGQEEIYWRLVRPSMKTDVGSLHRDSWFHKAMNNGQGMFADGAVTVKVWIPIFCEPEKSGLSLVKGSHLKDWSYHLVTSGGVARPVLDHDPATVDAQLMPTESGNMLIFNENVLHGGFVNQGAHTRVSAEITMVLDEKRSVM